MSYVLRAKVTATNITGILPVGSGGTGFGVAQDSIAHILNSQPPIPNPIADPAANNAAILQIITTLRTAGVIL